MLLSVAYVDIHCLKCLPLTSRLNKGLLSASTSQLILKSPRIIILLSGVMAFNVSAFAWQTVLEKPFVGDISL